MTPYFEDESATLYHGDALAVARELSSGSVDCIVTSPPYFALRDYGMEGQYGLEASPAEYVEVMRTLFGELRRVLADHGTAWINIGDSYASSGGHAANGANSMIRSKDQQDARNIPSRNTTGLPIKNLIGIPWKVAFALQADGWILRNAIVWHKPNAMPEAVRDRLSTTYEMVFMFSNAQKYWFDLDAIREPHSEKSIYQQEVARRRPHAPGKAAANQSDVWEIPTAPFAAAHFAVMAPALAARCVQAGCKPGGVVLDPFSGSGTTGLAAAKHGRRYVGIDLNSEYLDLSLRTRLLQPGLFEEGA